MTTASKERSLKQLKLVTGEELICEILDEDDRTITFNNALTLIEQTHSDGSKYFTFRNFMVYQDSPLNVMLLMSDKIMSVAVPTVDMIGQYKLALSEMAKQIEEWNNIADDEITTDDFINECESYSLIDSDVSGFIVH